MIAFLEEGHKGCCGVLDIRYRQIEKDAASQIVGNARVAAVDGLASAISIDEKA